MVIIQKVVLVTRNARDKVQVAIAVLSQNGNAFNINRSTGQYKGKMSTQPELVIERGKAKRSVIQQAELEFNSIISKYLDKGYKRFDALSDKEFDEVKITEMEVLVPTIKTDGNGEEKPMLAKSYDDCQNSVLEKLVYCSAKLNGVRCMMRWKDDKVITISRGGKHYDVSTQLITKELFEFLKENPNLTTDGEIYIHGEFLQRISGTARLGKWEERCEKLQYWIYDIACNDLTFEERLDILLVMQEKFKDSKRIKVIDHILAEGWDEVKKLHDKWVSEGFEGLVARKPDKLYQFGKRNSTMIKLKLTKDAEFTIIDYQDGLREEDFCFILETTKGQSFAAKPIGNRELKAEYLENIDSIIGKKGTVKYFELSKDGIPCQTRFIAVRDYE